jgi:hypothetical protein
LRDRSFLVALGIIAVRMNRPNKILEELMKTKIAVILSTLTVTLAMMAQSPAPVAAPGTSATGTCLCCPHNDADGKMNCCHKGAKCCSNHAACCKQGKCCQGKDGKPCEEMSMSKPPESGMRCCQNGVCQMDKTTGGCCGTKCKHGHTTA